MHDLKPIDTAHLFRILDEKLIALLRGLSVEEWGRKALPKWSVKDVAAHLLDTNLRRLSMARDGYWGESFQGSTPEEFIAFLNGLNHDWVRASRRLSSRVLVDLLENTGRELADYLQSLDPSMPAVFAVSWAGEEASANWFDIAREYTEKWHHQQQIREAVGRAGIMTTELYGPVIATFMRVLPHAYRQLQARAATTIAIRVAGDGGGEWLLVRANTGWELNGGTSEAVQCGIEIPGEIAWKLFTKGLNPDDAKRMIRFEGDVQLAQPLFTATAIVG